MKIEVSCIHCESVLVDDNLQLGAVVVCPHCSKAFIVDKIGSSKPQILSDVPKVSPTLYNKTTSKCPHCMQIIDINASTCPHCTKNVGLYNLQQRDPLAFQCGVGGMVISWPICYFVHSDFIISSFKAAACCYGIAIWPILLFAIYSLVGFYLGVLVSSALKSK